MKKFGLFGLFVLAMMCSGCNTGCDHYYVLEAENGWHTCIEGSDFDTSGLEVSLYCRKCHKREKVEDYTLENDKNLQADQAGITIKYQKYTLAYPITVKSEYHIACVGDSLTAGHYWANQSYPTYLSSKVTSNYKASNFGINGVSITGYGGNSNWDSPEYRYIKQDVYTSSLEFRPDIIAIMLGTNDATNWTAAEPGFIENYRILLDSYLNELPEVKFIMMVSPPAITPNQFGIQNDIIRDSVNPIQRDLAEEYDMALLDLREEFEAEEDYETKYLRPNDGVHFTEAAAEYVATRVWDITKDLRF